MFHMCAYTRAAAGPTSSKHGTVREVCCAWLPLGTLTLVKHAVHRLAVWAHLKSQTHLPISRHNYHLNTAPTLSQLTSASLFLLPHQNLCCSDHIWPHCDLAFHPPLPLLLLTFDHISPAASSILQIQGLRPAQPTRAHKQGHVKRINPIEKVLSFSRSHLHTHCSCIAGFPLLRRIPPYTQVITWKGLHWIF